MSIPDKKTIKDINKVAGELKKVRANKKKTNDPTKLAKLTGEEGRLLGRMSSFPLIAFSYIEAKNK